MRALMFAGTVVWASAGHALMAQTSSLLVLEDREANTQLTQIVETTRQRGLPVDPIIAKVQYSIRIMHAPSANIVASARKIASRLEVARDALAPASSNDIIAGADALGAGATKESLRAVRDVSGNKPVATSLAVLAQLIVAKVPVPRATEIVTSLIRRGATAEQLVALGNNVNDDVQHGAAALAALDARARFLSGVLAPSGTNTAPGLTTSSPQPPKKP